MKVIIAGGRNISDRSIVQAAVEVSGFEITEVVSGGAEGVDTLGWYWAQDNNKDRVLFRPDWGKHGKSAGPIRNSEMADYADALIAIWDGRSPGTRHMISRARKKGLQVYVHKVEK